ncbi:hypothetical protein AAVH_41375 [Aphelenchoides avenae]|nr:hypothetical protein AAVH_41375 [Aphelenchus avenae]
MDYLRKIPPEVAEDEFYLYKPDKKVGRPKGPTKVSAEGAKKGRPKSKEIGGTLADYEMGCGNHRRFKLDVMPVTQPPTSVFWSASTPLELARGAAVAEAVNMTAVDKEQFYMGTSPAVLELRLAEPTNDQIVMAMLKMVEDCPERKQAFVEAQHAPFKCTTTADPKKAARKIRIAERVRATLDGNKSLQVEETIVAGGRNATRFAAALGKANKIAPTLAELRTFLSSHFASSVKRVFIWLDLPDKTVVPDVFISAFAEELKAAAAWEHVLFVVLPPPYAELRLTLFEVFMEHFNKVSPTLKNVLWLDDRVRWDGYRFTRALGANELVIDNSSVYPEGTVSSKGAAAAIKFLQNLCGWLTIEPQDAGDRRQDASNEDPLHGTRGGRVAKNTARGAPARGGGGANPQGGRGPHKGQGRGNQSNTGHRRHGYK